MRARTGKIARLPGTLRHELNRRLHNGALGKELVPWLNTLPEVQSVLLTRFAGRPITEDNLSEWRRGGFQDWLREEERRVRLRELSEQKDQPDPEKRALRIAALATERLAVELAEELERLSGIKNRAERRKHFQRLSQELCRLQNSHTRERYLRLMEVKATRGFHPKSNPSVNHLKTKSELFGPFRAKDHGGRGGSLINPMVGTKPSCILDTSDEKG